MWPILFRHQIWPWVIKRHFESIGNMEAKTNFRSEVQTGNGPEMSLCTHVTDIISTPNFTLSHKKTFWIDWTMSRSTNIGETGDTGENRKFVNFHYNDYTLGPHCTLLYHTQVHKGIQKWFKVDWVIFRYRLKRKKLLETGSLHFRHETDYISMPKFSLFENGMKMPSRHTHKLWVITL